jgi:RNA polymerase sigma-70 factor (ECF subfamily)
MNREASALLPDSVLVEAAQAGDEAAFEELCRRSSPRLLRRLYQITNNQQDAEDALQECTLSAFLNLKSFDGRACFSTWFYRIGVNAALMILRKRRTRPEVSMDGGGIDGGPWIEWEFPDQRKGPEERYATIQTYELVTNAIDRLPEAYRSVARMRVGMESSIEEISQAIGISKAAAKSRLSRAKSALHTSLSRRGRKLTAHVHPYPVPGVTDANC